MNKCYSLTYRKHLLLTSSILNSFLKLIPRDIMSSKPIVVGVTLPEGTHTIPNLTKEGKWQAQVEVAVIVFSYLLSYCCTFDGITVMIFRFSLFVFF